MATESVAPRPSWLQLVVIGRNPRVTLIRILITVTAVFLTSHYVLRPIRVQGGSMLPTYRENRVNFVNRVAYLWSEPKRGDVVGIRFAGPSIMLLKRIIALPGETIEFRRGRAFVNGRRLDEPYLQMPCTWEIPPQTLGSEQYYVVGDNRSMPEADHTKGVAERRRIIGRILL